MLIIYHVLRIRHSVKTSSHLCDFFSEKSVLGGLRIEWPPILPNIDIYGSWRVSNWYHTDTNVVFFRRHIHCKQLWGNIFGLPFSQCSPILPVEASKPGLVWACLLMLCCKWFAIQYDQWFMVGRRSRIIKRIYILGWLYMQTWSGIRMVRSWPREPLCCN